MRDQFLGEELSPQENDAATARFQVVPCGLEATVSYGTGAKAGAEAIIAASHQLERLIEGREICQQGIYTTSALDCTQPIEQVMADLRQRTSAIAGRGQIPITLGGEHSLTFGAVMGVVDALDVPIGLVHIDAHADFRAAYQGQKHSHASVMHLLAEQGLAMTSFGVRALAQEEETARRAHGVICHDAGDLVRGNIHAVTLPDDFPEHIYITFDLDGLDPAILPATGTPVPGGLGFYQTLDLIKSTLIKKGGTRKVVGADVVELAPIAAQPASDFTAALIAYHLMNFAAK
ncbi:MAG: agmatinase family protein [Alphaproteobacteria bacterium]|nr:agmatinase family protein [Alphaproteobacteria bacterium]MBE8221060.1 agmatinase family protein [Alphaproteobacteria bacterium]